jgi:hypothetical protein
MSTAILKIRKTSTEMAYVPCIGDTGVTGSIVMVFPQGGGLLCADQVQGETGTAYDGPQYSGQNPLQFPYYSGSFAVGQRVTFTVAAGPYAPYATNVETY